MWFRRISESGVSGSSAYSEAKGDVLSEISRKAAIREAKQLASATQAEYVRADQKTRACEEMVRKVHQKEADQAMDVSLLLAFHTLTHTLTHTHTHNRWYRERGR